MLNIFARFISILLFHFCYSCYMCFFFLGFSRIRSIGRRETTNTRCTQSATRTGGIRTSGKSTIGTKYARNGMGRWIGGKSTAMVKWMCIRSRSEPLFRYEKHLKIFFFWIWFKPHANGFLLTFFFSTIRSFHDGTESCNYLEYNSARCKWRWFSIAYSKLV